MKQKDKAIYFKKIKAMLNTEGHIPKGVGFGMITVGVSEIVGSFNKFVWLNLVAYGIIAICLFLMIYHMGFSFYIMIKNYIAQKREQKKKR